MYMEIHIKRQVETDERREECGLQGLHLAEGGVYKNSLS